MNFFFDIMVVDKMDIIWMRQKCGMLFVYFTFIHDSKIHEIGKARDIDEVSSLLSLAGWKPLVVLSITNRLFFTCKEIFILTMTTRTIFMIMLLTLMMIHPYFIRRGGNFWLFCQSLSVSPKQKYEH